MNRWTREEITGSKEADEKVYFDDGVVRVTSSLVTIGPPWNKAFSVTAIRSVEYGKNQAGTFLRSIIHLMMLFFVCLGMLGVMVGSIFLGVFGFIMGLGLWWGKGKVEAPFAVRIRTGGILEDEILSTKDERWAEAVAEAILSALRDASGPGDGGQETRSNLILPSSGMMRN